MLKFTRKQSGLFLARQGEAMAGIAGRRGEWSSRVWINGQAFSIEANFNRFDEAKVWASKMADRLCRPLDDAAAGRSPA